MSAIFLGCCGAREQRRSHLIFDNPDIQVCKEDGMGFCRAEESLQMHVAHRYLLTYIR